MKRKQLNLLLGVLVLALVAAVYFSQEKPEPPPPPLTGLETDDINRILVRHAGKPDIRLENRSGVWWLTAPVETRAEPVEVSALVNLATRDSLRRYPAAEMNLAELGLDPTGWIVQLNDVRIEFGDTDPIESRRYLRIGETVHLIADPPSAALDAEYSDLVARRLLPEDAKITRIVLPGIKLQRTEKDGWAVTPESADQGADAAQKLVDAWRQADAMWITRLDKDKRAKGHVEIHAGDESFKFTILDREDQLILARPELGVQFTLSKTLDSDLFELKPPPEPEPSPEAELPPVETPEVAP